MSIDLNDSRALRSKDSEGLIDLAGRLGDQFRTGLSCPFTGPLPTEFTNILCIGMGGSAAGGDLASAWVRGTSPVPFIVSREYEIPNWAGAGTVALLCSYSGNTEETLNAYTMAREKGLQMVCIASGGELLARAQKDGATYCQIPGGLQPRMALGLLLGPILTLCQELELAPKFDPEALCSLLDTLGKEWGPDAAPTSLAKTIATNLYGSIPVIYGAGHAAGALASRWKGQINENAKWPCLSHSLPEMNHNEILAWERGEAAAKWSGIMLTTLATHPRDLLRAKETIKLLESACPMQILEPIGETLLQNLLASCLLADFVSLYLAALAEVDPVTIDSINHLKAYLARS